MPYFQRLFVSAAVVFVLLFSLCVLQPAKVSARKRCPVEIPDSLLTLYLKSDLIVVASIESERFLKTIEEYDHGSTYEAEKSLRIFETLRGRNSDSAAFRESGYKPKNPEQSDETSADAQPNVGDKALFFLTKDKDGFYRLSDSASGVKALEASDLNVYVKRIAELKRITATKKNQFEKLTEWLVRLAEEPVTREEGTVDLQASFRALEYETEGGEQDEEQEAANVKTLVLDEDFRAENTSEIAKLLTDSQKQRLSNALLFVVNNDLTKFNDAESEKEVTPDYQFISLVANWNKTSLAMTAFAFLQNAGDSNRHKVTYLLDIITHLLEDEELYTISSDYQSALAENETALTEFSAEETSETETISSESETPVGVENSAENKPVEPVAEETTAKIEAPLANETIEKPAAKITYKEYREKLYAKFIRQYGVAISQISAPK